MKSELDAYQYFFPAGWFLGIWGVLLWILFPLGLTIYPGEQHPAVMMGGFLLCFVAGFLMTAAPRFTSTSGPSRAEHFTAGALIVLLLFSSIFYQGILLQGVILSIFLFLIRYVVVRFLARKSDPPDAFVFLGIGLFTGVVGSLLTFIGSLTELPLELRSIGRVFFLQTYIMSLVIGVGSRLIPALMGFAPLPTDGKRFLSVSLRVYIGLGLIFVASYLIEALGDLQWGYLLRAVVLTYMFWKIWLIHRAPVRKAAQTYALSASAWAILLGHWGVVFFPEHRVHIIHVIFVSGLALLTLMVATRVTLSHGKHAMNLEINSKALIISGGLIFLAGLTRLSVGFAPAMYQPHLIYAGVTWISGLIVWGFIYLPRMLKAKTEANQS